MLNDYPGATVFFRGDANASFTPRSCNKRDILFQSYVKCLSLQVTPPQHLTNHHFIGNSSSSIDIVAQIASSSSISPMEELHEILCSKEKPLVASKHDIILTIWHQPNHSFSPPDSHHAPMVPNSRHKIIWSEDGVAKYRKFIQPTLVSLLSEWDMSGTASLSVFLQRIYNALTLAARSCNKVIDLSRPHQ